MKYVYQTTNDNCYQACLASLLNIDIDNIPIFENFDQVRNYIKSIDHTIIFIPGDQHPLYESKYPLGFSILNQQTLNGIHSVICDCGIIIHDPSSRPFSNPNFQTMLWSIVK
jgi:hypothetical protein